MFRMLFISLFSYFSIFAGQGQMVQTNGIELWAETFGDQKNPALVLVMGGCCQGVIWHESFCERLANEGFYVIRYDHRDSGLSTCIDFDKNPYDLMDVTKDLVGLLDGLSIEKAHFFGISLGGFLSELMAAHFPERVHSILIFGASPDIHPMNLAFAGLPPEEVAVLSPPTPHYLAFMEEFLKLSPRTEEEKLALRLDGWNRLNGDVFPLKEETNLKIHREFLARLRYPQGIVNHVLMLNLPHSEELIRAAPSKINVPTVILHGTEDPIFPPDHGDALSRAIVGSEYFLVEGMGHVPNDRFFELYIEILKRQAFKNG